MTDAQLLGLAAQACNIAKRDLEQGKFHCLLASYHEVDDRKLHRMTKIEDLIRERLGEDWLNDYAKKRVGFRILRECVDLLPPDAFIFGSVVNRFTPTEKFYELTPERRHELANQGHDEHHRASKAGLFMLCDSLFVIVQTAERACLYWQDLDPHGRPINKPSWTLGPQDDFGGQMKMFGEDRCHS